MKTRTATYSQSYGDTDGSIEHTSSSSDRLKEFEHQRSAFTGKSQHRRYSWWLPEHCREGQAKKII
jgi:hypothetical protein